MTNRCCKRIHDHRSFGEYFCSKPAKFFVDGKWYCTTHNPEHVKARRESNHAKLRAKFDAQEAAWKHATAVNNFNAACVAAIREISAGHNDPRALAASVLATEPKDPQEIA